MENVYNVGGKTKGCDLLIEMKRASSQEYSLIDLFCQEEGLAPQEKTTDSAFFMIIKDGNALLGFAIVEADPAERATIKYLYIKKSERGLGLGDGLLRATLNLLDLMGISEVFIEGHSTLTAFLAHEGLKPRPEAQQLFYCDVKEFFSRKCKGSRQE
ncbi:GNAT family N-acetyltransferase [Alkaliphilus crotonatoxidans]